MVKNNLSFIFVSAFYLIALFNPIFKKYDYGAGYPLILILAGLGLVLAIIEFRKKRESPRFEPAFLLAFGLMVLLSFFFSQTKNIGFGEVLAFASIVPLYLVMAYQKHKWIDRFLNVIAVSAVLAALLGFILYFTRGEVRMVGPFFNLLYHAHVWPNAFALFLLLAWPSFLRNWNFLRALGLGIVVSALILTFSRGALVAFAGQIVLLSIYFARRASKKALLGIILSILVAGLAYFGANYIRSLSHDVLDVGARISFGNEESLTSKQERVDFWKGALDLADDNPLFGYGPFSFRYAYNPIQETFLGNADHPHNIFLKIAAENGLVAALAFILFLVAGFGTVVTRFSSLKKGERDKVFVMGVAALGAFAHNLIDYNLNFAVNLFLLFVYLALIRSVIAKPEKKERKAILPLLLTVLLTIVAFFEGCLLVLSETQDESYLQYSFFPRNYYLNEADEAIANEDYDLADEFLDKQIDLNPLDAQAYYLRGVACDHADDAVYVNCFPFYEKALELAPMNDFNYYIEYLLHLRVADPDKVDEFAREAVVLVEMYFGYVENNVHFTAYTDNVEAAARFITTLFPHLDSAKNQELIYKMSLMIQKANVLRLEKTF